MVICLERGAVLHMAQLMPLPLTVSCFSKIQIGFTFLVPADLGSPGKRAVKWVYVKVRSSQNNHWPRRSHKSKAKQMEQQMRSEHTSTCVNVYGTFVVASVIRKTTKKHTKPSVPILRFKVRSTDAWRTRRARAYNGGLGAEPPAGYRGRAPGQGVRGAKPP